MAVGFGPLEMLLIALMLIAFPCAIWARIDARRGKRLPFRRAVTVAGILVGIFAAFITYDLVRELAKASATYQVHVAWGSLIIVMILLPVGSTFVGWLSYLFAHESAPKRAAVQDADGGDEPKIRVEETGNPYQPPSQ